MRWELGGDSVVGIKALNSYGAYTRFDVQGEAIAMRAFAEGSTNVQLVVPEFEANLTVEVSEVPLDD